MAATTRTMGHDYTTHNDYQRKCQICGKRRSAHVTHSADVAVVRGKHVWVCSCGKHGKAHGGYYGYRNAEQSMVEHLNAVQDEYEYEVIGLHEFVDPCTAKSRDARRWQRLGYQLWFDMTPRGRDKCALCGDEFYSRDHLH